MLYRPYEADKDKDAVYRIYQEVGWLDSSWEADIQDRFLADGRTLVAELDGEAECLVTSAPGRLRYLEDELPFAGCTGVATSRIARKQGFARRLVARLLAADAADGALVHGLGMFEQGFYNAVGYGTLPYQHWVSFDPATIRVDSTPRTPRRLTKDDVELLHASRLARRRGHGGVNLDPSIMTEVKTRPYDKRFALGYCDGPNGELTHCLACAPRGGEAGPYEVNFVVYQTGDQFLELMAVLKSLGDQARLVRMEQPPGIQLQDLIDHPFRHEVARRRSELACQNVARAEEQARILDLTGCLQRTALRCGDLRFNLRLSDPVEQFLGGEEGWRGVAGDYVVTLGESSGAEEGSDGSLPVLDASVNAFTRLWLGALPATGLAITDDLSGPPDLLQDLDYAFRLPPPHFDWGF